MSENKKVTWARLVPTGTDANGKETYDTVKLSDGEFAAAVDPNKQNDDAFLPDEFSGYTPEDTSKYLLSAALLGR